MFSKGHKIFNILLPITWICFYGLSFGKVFSQEATVTPIPGYVPTIHPTIDYEYLTENYECPPLTPGGYGTVTPSALWMQKCAHCLPENQQIITPTPATTQQPTAYPGDEFITGRFQDTDWWQLNGTGDFITWAEMGETYVGTETGVTYVNFMSRLWQNYGQENSTYDLTYYVNYQVQAPASSSIYWGYTRTMAFRFKNNTADYIEVEVYDIASGELENFWVLNPGALVEKNLWSASNQVPVDIDEWLAVEIRVYDSNASATDFQFYDYKTQWMSNGNDRLITVRYEPGLYSPDPEFESDCIAIVSEGDEEINDSAFDYDGLTFGAIYCVDLGPYEYSILGVEIDIPHIAHICVQEVGIGTITVFGVDVSLDIFIAFLGLAWVVRNMFIS
ncbi:MAG: hypothetical protein MUO40_13950 [Anaerolineaceae bacterium]|nr:hypothetical protein [Anaerolineaceae bacterium]